jgi:hypothetical protein
MEERVEDVERRLNEFLQQNKQKIRKIYDVSVNQNLNGKGWAGAITYVEKETPKKYTSHASKV